MDFSDELVGRAAFGKLSAEEWATATAPANMVAFGDAVRISLTRVQMQLEQYRRRARVVDLTPEDIAWEQSAGRFHSRCAKLWSDIRPAYRAANRMANTSAPGYRRAIEAHRAEVLEHFEPTDADRRLWAVLDPGPTPDPSRGA